MTQVTWIRLGLEIIQAAIQGSPKAWVRALDSARGLIVVEYPSCEEHDDAYAGKSEWDPPYLVVGTYEREKTNPRKHRIWYRPDGGILFNCGDHEPWCFTESGRRYAYWCSTEAVLVCPCPLRLTEEPDCPSVAAELNRREYEGPLTTTGRSSQGTSTWRTSSWRS